MEVRKISAAETYGLRSRVLRPGHPLEASFYPLDAEGAHFGLWENEKVLSVITAHPEDSILFDCRGQWRIRGMATEPARQGEGLGGQVLSAMLAWGKENSIPLMWCNAREKAIPFYLNAGFSVSSELFEISGIGPHKVMFIKL